MKQKIYFPLAITFVIVCAALLIVVVLKYSYFFSEPSEQPSDQTVEDETANWRIYRGGSLGYESEIKYPEDWMINLGGPLLVFAPETPRLSEKVWITMDIQLLRTEAFSITDLLEEPKEVYINNNRWYYEDKEFYQEYSEEAFRIRTYIFTNPDNSKVLTLRLNISGGRQTKNYYLPDSEVKNELKILNQMASTFRFLEKIETSILCPQEFVLKEVTYPYKAKNNDVICVEEMTTAKCVRCGNKICDKNEDWCICPEDCSRPNPEDLQIFIIPE